MLEKSVIIWTLMLLGKDNIWMGNCVGTLGASGMGLHINSALVRRVARVKFAHCAAATTVFISASHNVLYGCLISLKIQRVWFSLHSSRWDLNSARLQLFTAMFLPGRREESLLEQVRLGHSDKSAHSHSNSCLQPSFSWNNNMSVGDWHDARLRPPDPIRPSSWLRLTTTSCASIMRQASRKTNCVAAASVSWVWFSR